MNKKEKLYEEKLFQIFIQIIVIPIKTSRDNIFPFHLFKIIV